ncbi:hypothetical protein Vretimale_20046, partial [Volvox reticuliferus]
RDARHTTEECRLLNYLRHTFGGSLRHAQVQCGDGDIRHFPPLHPDEPVGEQQAIPGPSVQQHQRVSPQVQPEALAREQEQGQARIGTDSTIGTSAPLPTSSVSTEC